MYRSIVSPGVYKQLYWVALQRLSLSANIPSTSQFLDALKEGNMAFLLPPFKAGSQMKFENLDFKRIPTIHWYKLLTLIKFIMKTTWFMLTTFSPSRNLKYWHMIDRKCPSEQPQTKTMEIESLMSFPGRFFIHVATTYSWEN